MQVLIQDVTKTYRGGVQALKGLDLTIPGGMFGLLGPNGAGKTTLMRILAGILHPGSGTIQVGSIDGTTERGRNEIKHMLGYLPQELGMYPDLSAHEFLDYIAILKGITDRRARRARVDELLELVALQQVARRKIKTFSGGMKRRVGIAQALLNDPRFLIVDEPTAGLDPEERIRFRNLLSDLGGNRSVLLSTHIVEDIGQTCQNLAVMKSGRVIFQGTISELISQAQGHVWLLTITHNNIKPEGDFTIVSTFHQNNSIQYRIVGTPPPTLAALQVEPGLEDGYVWLMRADLPITQHLLHS